MKKIFEPIVMGELQLPNRIIMAPLTRCRAGNPGRVPNALMREYYVQRASAGLIMTEATVVSPMGIGYPDTPGIWSPQQAEGWKAITDAVHEAGGRIILQLWHVGRISDPKYLNGAIPVAPSAITPKGHVSLLRPKKEYVTPRALKTQEVKAIVEEFRNAAHLAKLANFDGVFIHSANGYLIDQFLQDGTNQRTDEYGGSLENRARLLMEVTDAVIGEWSAGKVGVHLAPRGDSHDISDSNPLQTFTYVAKELGRRNIAFISARESLGQNRLGPEIKKAFGGCYIANEGFTFETANQVIELGEADAVAFGKLFIANPDLPLRFAQNSPLNEPISETFYSSGMQGYTDYPLLTTSPQ